MYRIILIIFSIITILVCIHFNILRYLKNNLITLTDNLKYSKLPRVNCNSKVIISFTTTQKRIDKCRYTIESILNQTVKVDEIRINIPLEYEIPYWLKMLEREVEEFRIIICKKDLGPITKIIPTLIDKTVPMNCRIIYIDDDIIYNKNMVENLIMYSNIYPLYTICNKGWNVDKYPESRFKLLYDFIKGCIVSYDTHYVDVVQGFSGVLVRPFFFDMEKLTCYKDYPLESFYVDDVYISGILNNNNIKRISIGIPSGIPYIREIINEFLKTPTSLSSIYNNDKKNDCIVANHFKWKKQSFFNLK
jgi:hypothetical protein